MYPKQFINFFGDGRDEVDGANLLGRTLTRLKDPEFAAPTLLCNNDHRFLIRETLNACGIEPRAIVLEPVARNTAAAIAVAAKHVADADPDGILAVMPSDHLIGQDDAFVAAVKRGAAVARDKRLVLFGIQPSEAHTGYGYIERGAAIGETGRLSGRGLQGKARR